MLQSGGHEDMDDFVSKPWCREDGGERLDMLCGTARFLLQLTRRTIDRLLVRLETARWDFVDVAPGGETILPDEQKLWFITERSTQEWHHGRRAGMARYVHLRHLAVRKANGISVQGDDLSLVQLFAAEEFLRSITSFAGTEFLCGHNG